MDHCQMDEVAALAAATSVASAPLPGGATINVELEARETDWQVSSDLVVPGYAFNGQVPGPIIEGHVGDLLVVRLTNRLSEPTTIHWHGLRVPAGMDGTEMVQHPVEPGQTFEYRFTLPDAGTFWYHPHTHETEQLERGLYGALVVRGPAEPTLDGERVLVLDDLKVSSDGRLARFGGFSERLHGRLGEIRLVNGQAEPELVAAGGQTERWRIVNASSSRYVRLSIGHRPFTLLGTDGGFIPRPMTVSEALLTPGDRLDLAVGPFSEGDAVAIESLPYDRGMFKQEAGRYATLRVGTDQPSRASIPDTLRKIEPLVIEPVANRTVDFGFRPSFRSGFDWTIEGEAHHRGQPVKVGEVQVWDIVNSTAMDHPFHLHGFFFQVVAVNGNPPATISWEDTINVPARGRVRIAWLPDDRPGSWMYHCHVLEHAAAGMMAHFDVVR